MDTQRWARVGLCLLAATTFSFLQACSDSTQAPTGPVRTSELPGDPVDADRGSGLSQSLSSGGVVTAATFSTGAIQAIAPSGVTCAVGLITFDGLAGGAAPGTNYDNLLTVGQATLGERFAGQTLAFSGNFDVLSGTPTSPLTPLAGAANQNLNIYTPFPDNVLTGLGPIGFPNFNAIGEGSVAVRFKHKQSELAFEIYGSDPTAGAPVTVDFFQGDGTLLDTWVNDPSIDGTYGFATASGDKQIAGITIQNLDPAGVAYDDLCFPAVTAHATGSGHFQWGEKIRTFAFTASQYEDGSASGQWQIVNRAQGNKNHFEVACIGVVGNTAYIGGMVKHGDVGSPGDHAIFRVMDNGEGKNAPDDLVTLTWVFTTGVDVLTPFCADPPGYWADPANNVALPWLVVEKGNVQVH